MSDPLIQTGLFCFSCWGVICALFLLLFMHGRDLRRSQ
jgi:hypothetical protein